MVMRLTKHNLIKHMSKRRLLITGAIMIFFFLLLHQHPLKTMEKNDCFSIGGGCTTLYIYPTHTEKIYCHYLMPKCKKTVGLTIWNLFVDVSIIVISYYLAGAFMHMKS